MTDSSSCVILAQKMHKKNFFGGNHCSFHVLYINSDSNLKWKISLQWHFNPIVFNLEPFQQVNKTFNCTRYHGTQRNLFLQCRSQSWAFNNYFLSVFNDNTYLPVFFVHRELHNLDRTISRGCPPCAPKPKPNQVTMYRQLSSYDYEKMCKWACTLAAYAFEIIHCAWASYPWTGKLQTSPQCSRKEINHSL